MYTYNFTIKVPGEGTSIIPIKADSYSEAISKIYDIIDVYYEKGTTVTNYSFEEN